MHVSVKTGKSDITTAHKTAVHSKQRHFHPAHQQLGVFRMSSLLSEKRVRGKGGKTRQVKTDNPSTSYYYMHTHLRFFSPPPPNV